MKRNLFILLMLMTSFAFAEQPTPSRRPANAEGNSVSAGDTSGGGVELGLLLGGIASEYVSEEFGGFKSRHPIGFTAGISFLFFAGRSFSLDTGVYFATPKFGLGFDGVGALNITYKSIEVPLLVRWNIFDGFSFGVGGYVSEGLGNISTKGDLDTGGVSEKEQSFEEAKIKRMDVGVAAGVQARLPVADKLRFLIDVRYHHGMNNLNQSTNSGAVYTRSLRLLVGAGFTL